MLEVLSMDKDCGIVWVAHENMVDDDSADHYNVAPIARYEPVFGMDKRNAGRKALVD